MSATADNVGCYCAATAACTLFYFHTAVEWERTAGKQVRVPWYDEPLVLKSRQGDGPAWYIMRYATCSQNSCMPVRMRDKR